MTGKTGIDLYAGTGAVGIEMLRRGAEQVEFVETVRSRADAIAEELKNLGYAAISAVHRMDAIKALEKLTNQRFDIVFADPPYDIDPFEKIIQTLQRNDMLNPGSWIMFEHSARRELPETVHKASAIKKRRYGDSGLTVYSFD